MIEMRIGSTAGATNRAEGRTLFRAAIVFGGTSLVSAMLLFQLQLIVCKYILPWFGGSAAVWSTSMLFFQLLLLAGYAYSHLISKRLPIRRQSQLHIVLLVVCCLIIVVLSVRWPSAITPAVAWKSGSIASPALNVVRILLVAAGLPFFVLATTGPLLQHWFTGLGGDGRTYRLYAFSNIGSLIGLLTFPFLLEPVLRMTTQGRLWSGLFLLFCGGCTWCARQASENYQPTPEPTSESDSRISAPSLDRALWFLLSACASAMLLATTNILCQEITSIPLLWVLPLALYLFSFILSFDHPRWYKRGIFHPLFGIGVFALCLTTRFAMRTPQVVVMPILLFVACMICQGELVRLRPHVRELTAFYLTISAGGAAGGLFVALVAPRIFRFFTEYQISIGACMLLLLWCLWRDKTSWLFARGISAPLGIATGCFVVAYSAGYWVSPLPGLLEHYRFYPLLFLIAFIAVLGAFTKQRDADSQTSKFAAPQLLVAFLAVLAMVSLYQVAQPEPGLYLGKRNFYGALRVYELAQGGKALFHGQTLHGAQLNEPNNRLPMAYYGPESGIGILLQNHPKRASASEGLRLGVIGLGAGTLAAYGAPRDYLRYYEINPDVVELSAGPRPVFTYIQQSPAKIDVQLGDARVLLESEAGSGQTQNFDVLVLDAFSGDAGPVHLLTTEAFDTYWKHLIPQHGIIAIHVSSRHINLMPVIRGIAAHDNLALLERFTEAGYPFLDSLWVFLARTPEDLQVNGLSPQPSPLPINVAPRVWTDDYSDIVRLLY